MLEGAKFKGRFTIEPIGGGRTTASTNSDGPFAFRPTSDGSYRLIVRSVEGTGKYAVNIRASERRPGVFVVMETSRGSIELELFPEKAPKTVKNFLQYVEDGFYNGTIFHRVIENFMIQGGGMTAGLKEKQSRMPVEKESDNGLLNERGTLAAARTVDPHSATCQFFINVKNNEFLDKAKSRDKWGYCVFGKVVKGMDVVDAIRKVPTGPQGLHQDVPTEDVVIRSVREVP